MAACCCGLCAWGPAQQNGIPSPHDPEPLYTLHVYEDLVQVTALVMDRARHLNTQLQARDFAMQLDSGPVFRPKHIRLEGDDPISLAILLDESWPGAEKFTKTLGAALAHLPAGALTAEDHVSVYAFDCNLLEVARGVPALSPSLPLSLTNLLQKPQLHLSAKPVATPCAVRVGLWDALGVVGRQLETAPGRRIVLALSSGFGAESRNSSERVRLVLAAEGISVFGAIPTNDAASGPVLHGEQLFDLLCGGTGGVSTLVTEGGMLPWLTDVLRWVRGRYVLEFKRPSNGLAGLHQIEVTTHKRANHVFVSGALIPLRDPRLAADPYTVPNAPEEEPTMGTRRMPKPE